MQKRIHGLRLAKLFLTGALIFGWTHSQADILERWTTNNVSTNAGMQCVVYGNGRYVAYGEYRDAGVIFSSEDGVSWTLRHDGQYPAGLSFSGTLTYTGNRFFALGLFGTSAVSSNGIDWTVFSFPNYATMYGVAGGQSGYVAVGDKGYSFIGDLNTCFSTNGVNWTAMQSTSPNEVVFTDVTYAGGVFVAIGGGSLYLLGEPVEFGWFKSISVASGSQISFCKNLWIVPYAAGTNLINDGGGWQLINTGLPNVLGKVTFANNLFMARAGSHLVTSVDGTNWVLYPQTLPGITFRAPYVASDGKRVVTVGLGAATPLSGAEYNGFTYVSDPLVDIGISNSSPAMLRLSGLVGRSNRVEYVDTLSDLASNNWQTLTNLVLPTNPGFITDAASTNSSQRFYRSVLIP